MNLGQLRRRRSCATRPCCPRLLGHNAIAKCPHPILCAYLGCSAFRSTAPSSRYTPTPFLAYHARWQQRLVIQSASPWTDLTWNSRPMIARIMTAEEFEERRYELPDGGQWSELICGEAVSLHPPEAAHGSVVLNLSKALADWIEQTRTGYACFELGLILNRCPDTVCCPPISYFVAGDRWAEMDKMITDSRPALVVEVPSTPDRARLVPGRIQQYLEHGVAVVWVIDPKQQSITVQTILADPLVLSSADVLSSGAGWISTPGGEPVLAGFSLPVEHVFREPDWWGGRSRPSD